MKIARQLSLVVVLSASGLFAQPTPNSVQNPGSNTLPGLPNYGIAQGSVFVVYGKGGMGPTTLAQAPSLPLQTTLGGTSISVMVNGTTVNALMVYTLATQLAAVLPSNTPIGTGTLTVTYGGASGSTPIVVVASNFGILSQNETGTGPAVATHQDGSVVSGTNAANTSEEIVMWGTGLGPLPAGASDAGAPPGGNLSTPITVWVGGVQAKVEYHGRNPSDPGLDQINFTIPAGVTGCYISLVVQTGDQVSNTTTIASSATGKTCSDANGLSLSSLDPILNSNGSVRIGYIGLIQESINVSGVVSETIAIGSANFEKYTGLQLTTSASPFSAPSVGSCTVSIINSSTSTTTTTTNTIVATGLDAGPQIAVTPPSGSVVDLTTNTATRKGLYSGTFKSLPAGSYQIAGPGGADVGAFSTSVDLAAPVTWTNQSALTAGPIDRSKPLTLTWTGGNSNGYVLVEGLGEGTVKAGSVIGAIFVCIAPAAPGTFTVPPSVLLSLPTSATTSLGILLLGAEGTVQTFTAPGLDAGYIGTESITGGSVIWQ
jgi:uncharacterized protein (TIGR03437 family)